jgi:hypothetical protein
MPTIIDGTAGITFPNSTVQASAGSVLQVINATTTTLTTVASTTFTDTTLTATITPKFATSKILILISQVYFVARSNVDNGHGLQILRNGSSIFAPDSSYLGGYVYVVGGSLINLGGREFLQYLDSPASTSALTYKTQGKTDNTTNSGQVTYQNNSTPSIITLMEIAA